MSDLISIREKIKDVSAKLERANLLIDVLTQGIYPGQISKAVAFLVEKAIVERDQLKAELDQLSKDWEAALAASGTEPKSAEPA